MMRRLITTVDHAVGKPVFHNSSLWEVRRDIRCNLFDYTDFEKFFLSHSELDGKEIVLKYLDQFDDEEALELKKKL